MAVGGWTVTHIREHVDVLKQGERFLAGHKLYLYRSMTLFSKYRLPSTDAQYNMKKYFSTSHITLRAMVLKHSSYPSGGQPHLGIC